MKSLSTVLNCYVSTKIIWEGSTYNKIEWSPLYMVLDRNFISWYTSELSVDPEGVAVISGQTRFEELVDDEKGEYCISFKVISLSGSVGEMSIRLGYSEAVLWEAAINTLSEQHNIIEINNFEEISLSDKFPTTSTMTKLIINIEQERYHVSISLEQSASKSASEFIHKHNLDPEYHSAVEMEILRAQVRILNSIRTAFSALRTLTLQQCLARAEAERQVYEAEQHSSQLLNTIQNIEAVLPCILAAAPQQAAAEEASEEKLLQSLCTKFNLAQCPVVEGAISAEHWQQLSLQENEMLMMHNINIPIENEKNENGNFGLLSWEKKYASLLQKTRTISSIFKQKEAEFQSLKSNRALEIVKAENQNLREQTVLLRGEIMRLRDNIAEVKTAAALAMQNVSALGKDITTISVPVSASATKQQQQEEEEESGMGASATQSSGHSTGLYNQISPPATAKHKYTTGTPTAAEHSNGLQQQQQYAQATTWRREVAEQNQHFHSEQQQLQHGVLGMDVSPLQNGYSPEQHYHRNHTHQYDYPPPPPPPPHTIDLTAHTGGTHNDPASTSLPEASTGVEDALELALRSAHVLIVSDRLLRLLFDRYTSQDGKFLMNSFRYLRCLKECGITAKEEEVQQQHGNTRWLSYGVVSIIFNEALKVRTEDSIAVHGAASASAPNAYVRNTSTVLTLKGSADTRASALSHQQFLAALRSLALRLYADVIEEEYGVAVEHLKDAVRDTAAHLALELLMQDKIVPYAVQQDFMPWPLVHLERTLFALHHVPVAFTSLIPQCENLMRWFVHYASSGAGGSESNKVAKNLFESRRLRIEDTWPAALTYKALSRFAHDFGIVPYLLKEPDLFGLFQELMVWTGSHLAVSLQALPETVVQALTSGLNRQLSPERLAALDRVKLSVERISPATFVVTLCIIAMQVFPRETDGARLSKLLAWLLQGGGPSIVARSSS